MEGTLDRPMPATDSKPLDTLLQECRKVIVGQPHLLNRLLVALLVPGHVLLEGLPGLAKTRTVKTLAAASHLAFRRVQFTPDLLPSDVMGTLVFDPRSLTFTPRKGPVFTNLLLADEINRAPSKVQSALLEAMEERQVTLGEDSFPLPDPFLVLATQNPLEQEGTFPLPEAQMDRFLFKLKVDYPNAQDEGEVLRRAGGAEEPVVPVVSGPEILEAGRRPGRCAWTRPSAPTSCAWSRPPARAPGPWKGREMLRYGASPRASLALQAAAKALAWLDGPGPRPARRRHRPGPGRAAPPAAAHLRERSRRRHHRRGSSRPCWRPRPGLEIAMEPSARSPSSTPAAPWAWLPGQGSALAPGPSLDRILEQVPELAQLADLRLVMAFNRDSATLEPGHILTLARLVREAGGGQRRRGAGARHRHHGLHRLGAGLPAGRPGQAGGPHRLPAAPGLRPHRRPGQPGGRGHPCRPGRAEVGICFGDHWLRGVAADKVSVHRYQAFESPNLPALAELGLHVQMHPHAGRVPPPGARGVGAALESALEVYTPFPGMPWRLPAPATRGVLIQGFGAGNLPMGRAGPAGPVRPLPATRTCRW